jgi:hypothetical protein
LIQRFLEKHFLKNEKISGACLHSSIYFDCKKSWLFLVKYNNEYKWGVYLLLKNEKNDWDLIPVGYQDSKISEEVSMITSVLRKDKILFKKYISINNFADETSQDSLLQKGEINICP